MEQDNTLLFEEARLQDVCRVIEEYEERRKTLISEHQNTIKNLRQELMQTVGHNSRLELETKVRELTPFDPSLRFLPFKYASSPYLAGFGIKDNDPKIGQKFYLLGNQGLSDSHSKQVIVDWRQAAISQLYYSFDVGEEYEEEIGDFERSGVIEKKIQYVIKNKNLLKVIDAESVCEVSDKKDPSQPNFLIDPKKTIARSIERKEENGNFEMTDIIALISKEQFHHISSKHDGCFYLTGGAGSGKTTVALHRLSFLAFNHPDLFRPDRCLVVMFNKALKTYVKNTTKELLHPSTSIDTYHAWAEEALRSLGLFFQVDATFSATSIKKSAEMLNAIEDFIGQNKTSGSLIVDLGNFYRNKTIIEKYFPGHNQIQMLAKEGSLLATGAKKPHFDDMGILLFFAQKNTFKETPKAFSWYDHIVIDEAQDLSLIELKTLYNAASPRKSITICADTKQKILDQVGDDCFASFHEELRKSGMALGDLNISYRSTKQIMELASKVSGKPIGAVKTEGPEPKFHQQKTLQESLAALKKAVIALHLTEPYGLTAIVCRYKNDVLILSKYLKEFTFVRQELTFDPGIIITNIHQVKGLEFSNIILWNPNAKSYPATQSGRNMLYVAITRACNKLAIFYHDPLSPLLS